MTIPTPSTPGWNPGDIPAATGGGSPVSWAKAFQSKTDAATWGAEWVTPQQFDPLAGTSGHDCTAAINSAEACLGPGGVVYFPPGDYDFTSQLTSSRQQFCWVGDGEEQSVLHYTGANATNDIILLSGIDGLVMSGLGLQCSTTMTAGAGIHLLNVARAYVNVTLQGQDAFNTLGNKLWHGIWFDRIDDVHFSGRDVYAQADGIRANGDTASGGLKADLTIMSGTKVSECACGFRIGGALGGVYGGVITLALNQFNIVVDQTIAAQANREIFLIGTISDVTTSGPGLEMNDPGGVLLQATNCWFSSAAGHGVYIAQNTGRCFFTGCRAFNNGGDGYRIDAAASQVSIVAGGANNNAGWGINPNVANHNVTFDGMNLRDNASGTFNPAHIGLIASQGYWTVYQFLQIAQQLSIDPNFFMEIVGGNPIIGFDANDFYEYDRTANQHEMLVGSQLALVAAAAGVSMYQAGTLIGTFGANGLAMAAAKPIKTTSTTVADLPTAATVGDGARCFVTDATLVFSSANIGTAVTGGGTHETPVIVIGGAWVIG